MFKSDDVCNALKYRPISLLSNFHRISLTPNVLFLMETPVKRISTTQGNLGMGVFSISLKKSRVVYIKTDTFPSETCTTQLIYSANRQDHVIPLFVKAKVLSLTILYYESVLNFMHHIDERNAPIIIWNLFSRTSNSHHYFTRSPTSQDFHLKKSRLNTQKNAFFRVGADMARDAKYIA